jgi:hypothetical protein
MPNPNEEQRQALKRQAANMAITDGNLSQYLAGVAAVVALVSPPHAAVLGLGAAAMGVCGNYRQSVANDPPRDDYGEVWVSNATFDGPSAGADEYMAVLERFAAQLLLVCDGHYALLRALERYEGASAAGDTGAADNQAAAAEQNASRIANLQEELIPFATELPAVLEQLRQGRGFDEISLEDVRSLYRQAWGQPPNAMGVTLRRIATMISAAAADLYEPFDPVQAHPIMSAPDLPEDNVALLTGAWVSQMADNNVTLRLLVDG